MNEAASLLVFALSTTAATAARQTENEREMSSKKL